MTEIKKKVCLSIRIISRSSSVNSVGTFNGTMSGQHFAKRSCTTCLFSEASAAFNVLW